MPTTINIAAPRARLQAALRDLVLLIEGEAIP
jgi:hypothetical protein